MEDFLYICFDYTNLIVLNGNFFPSTNVLTCLLALGGPSVVDYEFMEACDLSIVYAFKIGPLSPHWDHKPLYLGWPYTLSQSINKCNKVKNDRYTNTTFEPCHDIIGIDDGLVSS